MHRRSFLAASAAAGLLSVPGAPARAGDQTGDARLDALLARQFEARLDDSPEGATDLGLDVGARAGQRARLDARSTEAALAAQARSARFLAELRAFDPSGLSAAGRLNYDIAEYELSTWAAYARFPYHRAEDWRLSPYVVSQIGGAYAVVPDFLDTSHRIEVRADAEAYLSRLRAFAVALDEDTARMRENAAMGAAPPDFILDGALRQLRALRDGPARDKAVVRSLARRAAEKGLDGYGPRAAALFEGPVTSALTRQIQTLEQLQKDAVHVAGIDRVPDGDAYYALNLRAYTTTDYSADEIHRIGLDQVGELQGRLDRLLRAQGYSEGTVGERINGLNREPRFLFANTDAGRAELLAYLNVEMAEIRALMPSVFETLPRGAFEIRRIPPEIQDGAPGGYAAAGSLDGVRPGAYYINLKDTEDWPRWGLKTLTYHEAAPGHLFQGALAREAGELPLYRKVGGWSAYAEGWGLYSERLADELGVYEDDPFGRIGYHQSFLFRAVRLVVDTGLHSRGWSREQAIRYMAENAAEPLNRAEREIERYCAAPGQACAYKLGEIEISRLRAEAERRSDFDLKRFHSALLLGGAMPLAILRRRVLSRG